MAFREFDDIKADEGMQGHRTRWGDIKETEKQMRGMEDDFKRMWKKAGKAPCPVVKIVLVCGKFGAYVSTQEIGNFRAALRAQASCGV
jgi:hypothetical protein